MSRPGSHGTLLTVAPTGAEHAKADVPQLPVTLDELVATAEACEQVGAAMVHVHIRGADTRPTLDLGLLKDTVAALRERTSLIVQLSTGGAVTDPEADRLRVLDALPDSASCTMGTVNFGEDVFLNRWEFVVALHKTMQERGIVPEYEIFDIGQLASLNRLLDKHGLPAGARCTSTWSWACPAACRVTWKQWSRRCACCRKVRPSRRPGSAAPRCRCCWPR
ncbi:3-keto-5-aminohexanoate cleavage protein [Actinosynnema sp. CA-248983]